ncbi:MAG: Translin family protein [uncultured Thermomicrobiales bacterium]|uniref:Translin family protein n=1 Tax=uncultured Thermomicrobiales bacterium TaxID=1645740 RepID=A0A6J4VRW6_9BACT|nr:MAG: Translin family protein [uncultured Thermomicrobiales bacterium]
MPEQLTAIGDQIIARLDATNAARERALGESRQIVRLCANCIRASHRGDLATARRLSSEARDRLAALATGLRDQPAIYWAGYVQDAQKEFVEARVFLSWIDKTDLPAPGDLGVADAVYLNGLGEAASELRRFALDRLRAGDVPPAEWALTTMDDVYSLLVTVDFPDAVTNGLRRTTDMVRGVLERTRGDVTVTVRQQSLERSLERALSRGA